MDLPFADVVYTHLEWGRPRTIGDLAEELGVPRRMVEAGVEQLRRSGAPICTGSEGVWLTDSGDELLDQYRRLRRRAVHQLANLRQLQRTARSLQGIRQTSLWGES